MAESLEIKPKTRGGLSKGKQRDGLFIFLVLLLPMLQFLVFYVIVNFNSIILAFQTYEKGDFVFNGIQNFKDVFKDIASDESMRFRFLNSGKLYLFGLLVSFPISIFVAYGVFRGIPAAGVFKVVLMLPQIIAGMVFVLIFTTVMEELVPVMFKNDELALLLRSDKSFWIIVWYGFFIGFGGNLVLYLGAMSSISPDLIEYGHLEGVNSLQEFRYIVFPGIWHTIKIFLITGIAGFFTNQASFFSFYGGSLASDKQTLGYWMFVTIVKQAAEPQYPYVAAMGLVFTVFASAITFTLKHFLDKYGPSED